MTDNIVRSYHFILKIDNQTIALLKGLCEYKRTTGTRLSVCQKHCKCARLREKTVQPKPKLIWSSARLIRLLPTGKQLVNQMVRLASVFTSMDAKVQHPRSQ